MQINFTVNYSIEIKDEDITLLKNLLKEGMPSAACTHLMRNYAVPLYIANCIRKSLGQNTVDFDIDLDRG